MTYLIGFLVEFVLLNRLFSV